MQWNRYLYHIDLAAQFCTKYLYYLMNKYHNFTHYLHIFTLLLSARFPANLWPLASDYTSRLRQ